MRTGPSPVGNCRVFLSFLNERLRPFVRSMGATAGNSPCRTFPDPAPRTLMLLTNGRAPYSYIWGCSLGGIASRVLVLLPDYNNRGTVSPNEQPHTRPGR